jgi:hypothetical protein
MNPVAVTELTAATPPDAGTVTTIAVFTAVDMSMGEKVKLYVSVSDADVDTA